MMRGWKAGIAAALLLAALVKADSLRPQVIFHCETDGGAANPACEFCAGAAAGALVRSLTIRTDSATPAEAYVGITTSGSPLLDRAVAETPLTGMQAGSSQNPTTSTAASFGTSNDSKLALLLFRTHPVSDDLASGAFQDEDWPFLEAGECMEVAVNAAVMMTVDARMEEWHANEQPF